MDEEFRGLSDTVVMGLINAGVRDSRGERVDGFLI